ncbi:uncharacterized protein DFL_009727 [Arthrobotrys flagrans]|uniref:Uncharacterized protein n=1 Tax=Arthrobotrys flagrans TaxID=97331 RepID=A0A436ZSG1_ARTFL|nr:hypothetical protein DFL_009727 [Arthrobotrys flagrans]
MNSFTELDSVRQQLEAFRFPSPTPTIRSHKIWSGQHLEPYLPSPRSMSPNLSVGSYLEANFVDSAYASPSAEELPLSPTTRKAMTLEDTLSELESIVRKYEVDEQMNMGNEEPMSFWEEDSEDEDSDFVDEAYDSGCFTEDDESFETRLASLQPPTKRPRLSEAEVPRDVSGAVVTGTSGVTILKPSPGLRLSKRMRMKRRQLSIPRSMPTGGKAVPVQLQGDWWSPKKPSPAFIDIFQF